MNGSIYFIEIINQKGEKGFVLDTPEGIMICTGGVTANITQFKRYELAERFIRKNRLNKSGNKAKVISNQDLMREKQNYYFDDKSVGYCAWYTEQDAKVAIVMLGLPMDTTVVKQPTKV